MGMFMTQISNNLQSFNNNNIEKNIGCFCNFMNYIVSKVKNIWMVFTGTNVKIGDPESYKQSLDLVLKGEKNGENKFTIDSCRDCNKQDRDLLDMRITFNDETNTVSLTRRDKDSENSKDSENKVRVVKNAFQEGVFSKECNSWLENKCNISHEQDRLYLTDLISLIFTQFATASFILDRSVVDDSFMSKVCIYDFDYEIKVEQEEGGITLEAKTTAMSPIYYMTPDKVAEFSYKDKNSSSFSSSASYIVPAGATNKLKVNLRRDADDNATLFVSDDKTVYKLEKGKVPAR